MGRESGKFAILQSGIESRIEPYHGSIHGHGMMLMPSIIVLEGMR
jgi:hypothetical protein